MASPTLLWYDLETTGTDTRGDRILQLAAQRTDLRLRPVGPPINLFCRPDPDILPQVDACMVTGLDPLALDREGLEPPAFVRAMLQEMSVPQTCSVGYNSLRFDDEVVRHTLWRHLYDPYGREWRNGNSRWDVLVLTRMCLALRPEALTWPTSDDGHASLRLEDLAQANGLEHQHAHDALSDVQATLGLARRIQEREPRLFQYVFRLRDKREARRWMRLDDPAPVLHVHNGWGRERRGLTAALALGTLPGNANSVVMVDLTRDPAELLDCPDGALPDLLFPEWGSPLRSPVRLARLNRCPAVAPVGVLQPAQAAALDLDRCEGHARRLLAARDTLLPRLQAAWADRTFASSEDPERQLYDGFLPDADRDRCARVHQEGTGAPVRFDDPRLNELYFRYRARYHPDGLDAQERRRWQAHLRRRLVDGEGGNGVGLSTYSEDLARWRAREDPTADQVRLLDALEAFGRRRREALGDGDTLG